MKKQQDKPVESKCSACDGSGVEAVSKQTQPGYRIYPPQCKQCGGKGRTRKTAGS
jgi:DnaJ-class molecular chaperone